MQESVKVKRVTILSGYVVFSFDMGDFFDIMQINYITRFQFSYALFNMFSVTKNSTTSHRESS